MKPHTFHDDPEAHDLAVLNAADIQVQCERPIFCDALSRYFHNDTRRGFTSITSLNVKTGTSRLIGVRYCDTAKTSDKGVMLNFCPFCGIDLQWWESAPPAER